jgi:hypothetical protein
MENRKTIQQLKNEVYNIEKAINRLSWRFKNNNIKVNESKIIINEADVLAVDFLVNWINQQKQETLKGNLLFAKLFCYAFHNELTFYNGDAKLAQQKIVEQLKIPIGYHYDKIHDTLNMLELNNYMKQIGVIQKHPLTRNDEENKKNAELFKINNKEIVKKIMGTWSVENVYKSLNNTITECINRFKNTE